MAVASRFRLAWACLMVFAMATAARADDGLPVTAGTPLVLLRGQGINLANVRAQPDPRPGAPP